MHRLAQQWGCQSGSVNRCVAVQSSLMLTSKGVHGLWSTTVVLPFYAVLRQYLTAPAYGKLHEPLVKCGLGMLNVWFTACTAALAFAWQQFTGAPVGVWSLGFGQVAANCMMGIGQNRVCASGCFEVYCCMQGL